jgi:hypothetical protein
MRRTFKLLQKEGHVDEDAKVLLHANEKLITELEIARHEIQGLRKTIIHEKKKRKRGKAMNLYDPEEKEGQAMFFSPAKVGRCRDRAESEKQAEQQRKQIASDKKLQKAIARDEKAREAEEKRIARDLARQAAREELAREKAERQTNREAKKAQKATEAAKRRQTVAKAKAHRIQPKETIQTGVKMKKRSLNKNESERPKKRPRTQTSHSQTAVKSNDLLSLSDNRATQLSDNTLLTRDLTQSSNRMRNAEERPISLAMRSGHTARLPARFL